MNFNGFRKFFQSFDSIIYAADPFIQNRVNHTFMDICDFSPAHKQDRELVFEYFCNLNGEDDKVLPIKNSG